MSIDYSANLAKQIGRYRKSSGMTQEQLAGRLGVTYQAVSKWENGASSPDVTLLPQLAEAFGISLDELFGRPRPNVDLRRGLLAEWLFDGGAADGSGNGLHGTVSGAVPCPDRFGRPNRAIAFDGKDDFIVVDPPPALRADGFTLSVWCRYDEPVPAEGWCHAIVSQDGGHDGIRVFQLSTCDRTVTFHRFLESADLTAGSPLRTGYWYHFVVAYESGLFKLYKNGELAGELEGELRPDPREPIYIGRKATEEPYFFFRGVIDDVRLYDRAVNADEVKALFLENGWRPQPEPALPVDAASEPPVMDFVTDVRLRLSEERIDAAASWYKVVLGYKPMMEQPGKFHILSLYRGPELLLHAVPGTEAEAAGEWAPFFCKTRRNLEELKAYLTEQGAVFESETDDGYASFLHVRDPFGQRWTFIRWKSAH